MNALVDSARQIRFYLLASLILALAVLLHSAPARSQCTNGPPSTPTESLVAAGSGTTFARDASIGMDSNGRFVIAYQQSGLTDPNCTNLNPNNDSDILVRHYCQDGTAIGVARITAPCQGAAGNVGFFEPSVALDRKSTRLNSSHVSESRM